ncbi:MAG: hypothetical protein HC828_07995 [Blastochloris sp.]|nr:hypothetical protein [Blastochloris sp.]
MLVLLKRLIPILGNSYKIPLQTALILPFTLQNADRLERHFCYAGLLASRQPGSFWEFVVV